MNMEVYISIQMGPVPVSLIQRFPHYDPLVLKDFCLFTCEDLFLANGVGTAHYERARARPHSSQAPFHSKRNDMLLSREIVARVTVAV